MPVDEVPQGVLAGDVPIALGDGVDGHDLRTAGDGDALDKGFFATAGFEDSFLGFADCVGLLCDFWGLAREFFVPTSFVFTEAIFQLRSNHNSDY